MKQKPILREAETKDMKSIIYLMEKLIEHELTMVDTPVIEDLDERKRIVMETVAQALVDPDKKIWVVDKSGRILGVFIVAKILMPLAIEKLNPICVFTHGYSQKTVISFYEIHNRVKQWAKEKGCKTIRVVQFVQNKKAQKILELLGYNKTSFNYELEV